MNPERLNWPQVWMLALIRPTTATYDKIVHCSAVSLRRAYGWMALAAGVLAVLQWTAFDVFSTRLLADAELSPAAKWLLLPAAVAVLLLVFALLTMLAHIITVTGGGVGTYPELAYAFAAFLAPLLLIANLLFIIPYGALIGLPVGLYALVLMAAAITATHRLGWKPAILSVVWLVVLLTLILAVVVIVVTLVLMVFVRGVTSTLRGVVRAAAPMVIAAQGELITERSGVINLSLDGTIMLSAMTAHTVALNTNSHIEAILAAMSVGAVIAFIVVFSSIALRLNQVAIGFILTILAADMAVFLGKPHYLQTGKAIPSLPIPLLEDIPFFGPVLFRHNILIYISILLPLLVWFYIYRTRPGLTLRSIGEQPEAAFVRGTRVQFWRYVYTLAGGALVGLAGATYSLSVKLGWREDLGGEGWIALAIVIFGLWLPGRIALGAYLIVGLRTIAIDLQSSEIIDLPAQIVNMLPWFLMIFTLMFATSGVLQNIVRFTPMRFRPAVSRFLRAAPPRALGTTFEKH